MRIYVGNLSFNTEEQGLQDLFTTYGPVESVRLIRDQMTGRSRGFGFVEMSTEQEAKAAVSALDGQMFEGRALTVNIARPKEGGGGGGGGGGGRGGRGGGGGGGGGRW